jgi:hypothetical protein
LKQRILIPTPFPVFLIDKVEFFRETEVEVTLVRTISSFFTFNSFVSDAEEDFQPPNFLTPKFGWNQIKEVA